MLRFITPLLLTGLLIPSIAAPAVAQSNETSDDRSSDSGKGFYAVGRVGGTVGNEGKLSVNSSTFQDSTKYKAGVTGEIGGGYDFGMFRIEQTAGYSDLKLNAKKANVDNFSTDGRAKMLTMSVSGFFDIPAGHIITPYIGGGAGIARVDGNLTRVDRVSGDTSSYDGKKFGILLHADAGIGVAVAPKVTLEIGGRYTRISGLKFKGDNLQIATIYKPKFSSVSGLIGVRYRF